MAGTNAVYTFKKGGAEGQDVFLYDNCDAYPAGVASKLSVAFAQSEAQLAKRSLPKSRAMFEALAVGDIPDGPERLVKISDLSSAPTTNFRYEIQERGREIQVAALYPGCQDWNTEFSGSLREFAIWARDKDCIEA